MIVYFDTNALLRRVLADYHYAADFRKALATHEANGDVLVTSELTTVEVPRALRQVQAPPTLAPLVLRGLDIVLMTPAILGNAAAFPDQYLRALDAIHLASAEAAQAGVLVTYDKKLLTASKNNGLATSSPGMLKRGGGLAHKTT